MTWTMNEQLMTVRQLPILEERLKDLKQHWENKAAELDNMVCTEDTIQACKSARAEFRKEYADVEEQKKAVISAVMEPIRQFEEVYRECVKDPYAAADARARDKINAVEMVQKQRCETELRDYFSELCLAHHVGWLRFEQSDIKIDLASAKAKTPKKLREQLAAFVARVSDDVTTIADMERADEVMAEYKLSLNLGQAIGIVNDRHKRIEEEKAALAANEEARQREAEAVAKVEAAIQPPVVVEPPTEVKTYTCTFTVKATLDKLKLLKAFLNENGIEFK